MSNENFRVFEFSRKNKDTGKVEYKAQLIVKGFDVVCYGETMLPANLPEEVALKFFEDAEKAVLNKIDSEYDQKYSGG